MALTSPRFASSSFLKKVAVNHRSLKNGSKGHAVNVVQQALIDLKYPLAKSDGIFGSKTEAIVKDFQRRNRLYTDGVVGRQTITRLDSLLQGYQHRVRLHYRTIALQQVSFDTSFKCTQLVYAQYGIKVEMGSGQCLYLNPQQTKLFSTINGSCKWNISSGEVAQLHSMGGGSPANEILVFYVNKFSESIVGCGGHAPGRPAVTVAAGGTQWTTAHEVAHALLTSSFAPVHSSNRNNLMYSSTAGITGTPILDQAQLQQIRRNPCCKPI